MKYINSIFILLIILITIQGSLIIYEIVKKNNFKLPTEENKTKTANKENKKKTPNKENKSEIKNLIDNNLEIKNYLNLFDENYFSNSFYNEPSIKKYEKDEFLSDIGCELYISRKFLLNKRVKIREKSFSTEELSAIRKLVREENKNHDDIIIFFDVENKKWVDLYHKFNNVSNLDCKDLNVFYSDRFYDYLTSKELIGKMFNYTIDPVNVLCDFSFCFWYELEYQEKIQNEYMDNMAFDKYLFSKEYIAEVEKNILYKAKSSKDLEIILHANGNINLSLFQENYNNITHIMHNVTNEIIKNRTYKTDEKDFYLFVMEIYKNIYENLYIYKYTPKIIQIMSKNARSMEAHVFKLFLGVCLDENRAYCADDVDEIFECCSKSALKETLKRLKTVLYQPYFLSFRHRNFENCAVYKKSSSICYSNLRRIEKRIDNEFFNFSSRVKMNLVIKPKNELLTSIKNDLKSEKIFFEEIPSMFKICKNK